jgi:acetolactate synthase regulatory subunit
MSSSPMHPLAAAGSDERTAVRRRFALEVGTAPNVLVRVLALLRRRQCRVVAVQFHEADRHGPGRFELTVLAPPRAVDRVEAWLGGLVDVYAVFDPDGGPVAVSPRARPAAVARVAL